MDAGEPRDEELVRRFRGGDENAFADLMRRHERHVYNLAYRMLGRGEDARDATQDAFVACYRNLDRFRGDALFSTWLHRIAVNACYDLLRKRRPETSLDDEAAPEPATVDHADRAVAQADVQRALLTVPPEFRAVLVMFELQDMAVDQIAAALDVPVGTVKSRLHRGRAALGRALAEGEPPDVGGPSKTTSP